MSIGTVGLSSVTDESGGGGHWLGAVALLAVAGSDGCTGGGILVLGKSLLTVFPAFFSLPLQEFPETFPVLSFLVLI